MAVFTEYIHFSTKGGAQVIDITPDVAEKVEESKIKSGVVNVNVIGSTGAITTCEYEPGLVQDIKEIFDKLIPAGRYNHDQTWGDGNGHSHLRSSLIGPSITLPFVNTKLVLGTWQQIIFIDFDNRRRDRELIVQVVGE